MNIVTFSDISSDPRVLRQVELFQGAECDVHVFCIGNKYDRRFQSNVKISIFHVERKTKSFKENLYNYLKFFIYLTIVFKRSSKNNLKSILLFNNMPNFLVFSVWFGRKQYEQIILDMHDSMLDIYLSKVDLNKVTFLQSILVHILKVEEKLSARFCDNIITVNRVIANDIQQRNNLHGIHLIHNVQDNYLEYKQPESYKFLLKEKINLIHHGNINSQNGIQNCLQVLHNIPNLEKFHVIGDGVYLPELKSLVAKYELNHIFEYVGAFKIENLEQYVPKNAIALISPDKSPQMHQALHVKVLDYCILGVPVICRRLNALETYFGNDSIYFFDDVFEIPCIIADICSRGSDVMERTLKAQLLVKELSWSVEQKTLQKIVENKYA